MPKAISLEPDPGTKTFDDIWDCIDKILDMNIEELVEKADKENWRVQHLEFWLKIKNAQNLEAISNSLREIKHGIGQEWSFHETCIMYVSRVPLDLLQGIIKTHDFFAGM